MTVVNTPQPDPVPDAPLDGAAPQPYLSPDSAVIALSTRYAITASVSIGHLLVASMKLDEEGPFLGVKFSPVQDRQWPRTFMYGWPNLIATPSSVMVAESYAGAWLLDYEQVVPQQLLDWVALEAYRLVTLPFDHGVVKEAIDGASVQYGGYGMLDELQCSLVRPFQVRQGHTSAFPDFSQV